MERPAPSRLAVVAALPEEIQPFRQRLGGAKRIRFQEGRAVEGILWDRPTVLMATGDGATLAKAGMERLLDAIEVETAIIVGIAGGLSEDLAVGSVVVAERVINGVGDVPPPDVQLLAAAADLATVKQGRVYSHSEIAVDPVAKKRLWMESGGQQASVVDLESASYARAAAARKIPYLVMRAVSDSYDEALPLDFNRFRKPDGSSDRGRVLRYTLRHPSIVPELMQLKERLGHCAERLAMLVEELLRR